MRYAEKPIIIGAVHLPYYGRNNPTQSVAELEEYVMTNVRFIRKWNRYRIYSG